MIYTPSTSFLVGMKTSQRSPLLPRTFLGDLIMLCLCLCWHQQNQCCCFAHVAGKLSHKEVTDRQEGYPGYSRETWSSISRARGKTFLGTLASSGRGIWTRRSPAFPFFSAPHCTAGDKEPPFSLWHPFSSTQS